jgi:hypothetical protein
MPQQPEKQIPWWLAIDLGVILVSLVIIAVVDLDGTLASPTGPNASCARVVVIPHSKIT